MKSKMPFFAPKVWSVLRFSSKCLFFRIWIQKVLNLAIFTWLVNFIHFSPLSQEYFRFFC
ncbi:hypothetical protein Hanom_Chr10g00881601 [Helianthus anomalus]